MQMAMNLLKAHHVGIRELKERLSAFLNKEEPIVITDRGEPKGVFLPFEDILELLDIIDEMNDKETKRLVDEGRKAIQSGAKGIPVFPKGKKNIKHQ